MGGLLLKRIEEKVLVMTGATGTVLQGEGANLGGSVTQWIADHPASYADLLKEYFRVGCDIATASTFTANRISLAKFNLAERTEELNRKVVQIVKAIRPEGTFVAGNMGPTGKLMKPWGELDPEEVREAYAEQARALAEAGAEAIYILTMYDLEEAVVALRAVKTNTAIPAIVSLAFNPGPKGYRTMMGVSPEAAAERLETEGADVIGLNCGSISPTQATEVLQIMKAHCRKPLLAKPNAGSPKVVDGREQYIFTPEQFAERVSEWIQAGARIVSACCGSSPRHLEAMVKAMSNG